MTTEEVKEEYTFQQPRLLRGHPRWAPTNNPKDINCFHFLIPIPKRSYAKKQYMWLTQRNDLNSFEDKKRLKNELIYYGSLMDCVRLKYLSVSTSVGPTDSVRSTSRSIALSKPETVEPL